MSLVDLVPQRRLQFRGIVKSFYSLDYHNTNASFTLWIWAFFMNTIFRTSKLTPYNYRIIASKSENCMFQFYIKVTVSQIFRDFCGFSEWCRIREIDLIGSKFFEKVRGAPHGVEVRFFFIIKTKGCQSLKSKGASTRWQYTVAFLEKSENTR